MYIRIGSVLRRKRLLVVLYPQLPSLFASEICRENRRLRDDLRKLRRLVDKTRNEISNQHEIAGKILDEFLKEKSKVCLGHQKICHENRHLMEEFWRLQKKQMRLKKDLRMVIELFASTENRSTSRGQDSTEEKDLYAILNEKSGEIHGKNAEVVSRFYKAAFTVLTSYTSLCGLSFVCGGLKLFIGLVAVAMTALILSCVNALLQVNKNGKKLQLVEQAKSRTPKEFFEGYNPVEPSTRLVLKLVWRHMLHIIVFSILAVIYLVYLAFYMHKEGCRSKLLSYVSSLLG